MMTDPIADMLTRIRNANRIERPAVEMPATKLKVDARQGAQGRGLHPRLPVGKYATDDRAAPRTFQRGRRRSASRTSSCRCS